VTADRDTQALVERVRRTARRGSTEYLLIDAYDALAARLEACETALRFYAERREYQHAGPGPMHDLKTCPIALRDSWDGNGPGTRARAALNLRSTHENSS
jgi:hypothetical protein